MTRASTFRHFRTNPIEILIFLFVAAIFGKSLYSLVYDEQSLTTTAQSVALQPTAEGRAPASVTQSNFANFEFACDKSGDHEMTASKIRLTGPLCGLTHSTASATPSLIRVSVINTANKFSATVFTDLSGGKFSTDYIPLNAGKNPIQVEFAYKDAKSITQQISINKN